MDKLAMFVTKRGVLFSLSLSLSLSLLLSFEIATQIAGQTAASRDVRVVREGASAVLREGYAAGLSWLG